MLGLRSSLSALGTTTATQSWSYSEIVGLPSLRLCAKSSLRTQSRQLRTQLLPSFTFTIPSLRRMGASQSGGAGTTTSYASYIEQLKGAREEIKKILAEKKAHGLLMRVAFHDAGTYDKRIAEFGTRGGANGSLQFAAEEDEKINAGLVNGVNLLAPIKQKYPSISYADLFQLASATAIEDAGGPKIPMKYGRVDTSTVEGPAVANNLPIPDPPVPSDHLRKVFYRMGFGDKEIVALSGAHTIGRAHPNLSGFGKAETKYTNPPDNTNLGVRGGESWTVDWLTFDNSYFKDIKAQTDPDLVVLPTDNILTKDPGFKPYTDKYAADQAAFFRDYAVAHKKLSELGSKFDPPEGYHLDDGPQITATSSSGSEQAS